jgi:hypothetical protein
VKIYPFGPSEPLDSALSTLERLTGLTASLEIHRSASDGQITFKSPTGHAATLAYEVKPNIDRQDQLAAFEHLQGGALLVTRSLSSAMIEQCRRRDIQFIDLAGNCFLRQPGMFVFVSGRRENVSAQVSATRGLTPAALRVVLAGLSQPAILHGSVRRIAEIANISHGATGIALVTLEETGLIGKTPSGRRMMVHPERWTEGYLGRLRPKLTTYRMSAATALSSLLEQVSPVMQELLLGGEAAAKHAELGLKPGALTLYIDVQNEHVMRNLVRELKLRRDPDGPVELVEIFWNTQALPSFPAVPDALVYADLIGSGDERTLDIAAKLKKRIIDDVAGQA